MYNDLSPHTWKILLRILKISILKVKSKDKLKKNKDQEKSENFYKCLFLILNSKTILHRVILRTVGPKANSFSGDQLCMKRLLCKDKILIFA